MTKIRPQIILLLLLAVALSLIVFASFRADQGSVTPAPPTFSSEMLTAAMATHFAATPSNTPPADVTIVPMVGDLGWGSVHGQVLDGTTFQPIAGATVTCKHSSYNPQYPCDAVTVTDADGRYIFTPIYFHDTDIIILEVEAPGYAPIHFEETPLRRADAEINVGLFPEVNVSEVPPTLGVMCTPPLCRDGVLACGIESGCPGGCGTVCVNFTVTP